jgi:hypothetical protein
VTVAFTAHVLTSELLQQFRFGASGGVSTALVALYVAIEARGGDTRRAAGLRPISIAFQRPPRAVFRFVMGHGLQADDVSRALRHISAG